MARHKVIKSTGDTEAFSKAKLTRSLLRSGVPEAVAQEVVREVIRDGNLRSTEEIHKAVYRHLVKKKERPLAAKYNLKRALTQMGPSGYPFEQFVARLLDAKGYKVVTNRILQGKCVTHEVDVLGTKEEKGKKKHFIFECKFHNRPGYKSDVQTALYMKARYDDIRLRWEDIEKKHRGKKCVGPHCEDKEHIHHVWIVTNTDFTSEAKNYARCAGVGLMSWRFPVGHSLSELIEETGLHPVTALTRLSHAQKHKLINKGIVLCRDIRTNQHILKRYGIRGRKLSQIIAEADTICGG